MWMYWTLFFIPAFFAIKFPLNLNFNDGRQGKWNILWKAFFLFLILIIGFRYEVGGDWINYLRNQRLIEATPFDVLVFENEPAYVLLTWMGGLWGSVYLFNFVAGTLFSYGLVKLCLYQPRPWLAMSISIPYLVNVVAMGYSRQAAAIGAFMLGLLALSSKKQYQFLLWIFIGSLFHKSLIIYSFLFVLHKKLSAQRVIINLVLFLGFYSFFYDKYFDVYKTNYIDTFYNSFGALIRMLLNIAPASIFLILRKQFYFNSVEEKHILTFLSFLMLLGGPLLLISPSSTIVDRVYLYLIPFQIIVWPRVPDLFGKDQRNSYGLIFLIILMYFIIEYVWLFYSDFMWAWLPYRFYPWELLID